MNERFENLMYQSGLTAQGCWDKMDSYDRQSIEKFAELIVRECINEIHVADVGDLKGKSYYLDKVAEHIEKHFGVEE